MQDEKLKRLRLLASQASVHYGVQMTVEPCGRGYDLVNYKDEPVFFTYPNLSRRLRDIIQKGERRCN